MKQDARKLVFPGDMMDSAWSRLLSSWAGRYLLVAGGLCPFSFARESSMTDWKSEKAPWCRACCTGSLSCPLAQRWMMRRRPRERLRRLLLRAPRRVCAGGAGVAVVAHVRVRPPPTPPLPPMPPLVSHFLARYATHLHGE